MADIELSVHGFKVKGFFETWSVEKIDINLGGITLPSLSPGWLAGQLAAGAAAWVRGQLFKGIMQAIGHGGPSLQDLLQRLLREVGTLVETAIRNNELRELNASLEAIVRDMSEYMTNPDSTYRLENATTASSGILSGAKSLGLPGYPVFLSATSMRIAILQQAYRRDRDERENLLRCIEESCDYHKETKQRWMDAVATGGKSPTGLLKNGRLADKRVKEFGGIPLAKLPRVGPKHPRMQRYMELQLKGSSGMEAHYRRINLNKIIKVTIASNPPLVAVVDWDKLRAKLLEAYFNAGDVCVARWLQAAKIPKRA